MAQGTGIEWAQNADGSPGATWNPIAGCTPNSPGCLNCYAAKMSHRLGRMGQQKYVGLTVLRNGVRTFNGTISFDEAALAVPLKRRKPTMYFVNSMSDLFHEAVPFEFVDCVFAVMAICPQHTFQVLTKRPERMAEYMVGNRGPYKFEADSTTSSFWVDAARDDVCPGGDHWSRRARDADMPWPLPNVWLGCSPVNQQTFAEYMPHILNVPAAVRFLSLEPLLGPIEFSNVSRRTDAVAQLGKKALSGIDWVIVGGESGPGARPCNVAWVRSVVEQCRAVDVPVFVKQLGANVRDRNDAGFMGDTGDAWNVDPIHDVELSPNGFREEYQGAPVRVLLSDKKGGDMAEWPADMRVRQMPRVAEVAHA